MKSTKEDGSPSTMDEQTFHAEMREAYSKQEALEDTLHGNDYKISASLPADLYRRFYQYLKRADMYKAEGVRFAIYKLLSDQP